MARPKPDKPIRMSMNLRLNDDDQDAFDDAAEVVDAYGIHNNHALLRMMIRHVAQSNPRRSGLTYRGLRMLPPESEET